MPTVTSSPTTATVVAQPKWILKSTTIWGGLIAAFSAAAPVISAITGADITADDVKSVGIGVSQVAQAVGGLVGLGIVIWGRLKKSAQPVTLGSTNTTKEVEVPKAVRVAK